MYPIPYISPQLVKELKQIDLLSYLQQTDPEELKRVGSHYITQTHDSLVINPANGLWHWHSRDIAGNNALSYLMSVRGLPFYDALRELMSKEIRPTYPDEREKPKEERKLLLPPPHTDNNKVIQYLVDRRGIHPAIVRFCIENRLLYEGVETDDEGRKHHNAVFVAYDENSIARYGFIRGTGKADYRRDADGSDKRYSFCIPATNTGTGTVLRKSEAVIDALSVATFAYMKDPTHWRDCHYLSAGGSAKVPIDRYLNEHSQINTIEFYDDNDRSGHIITPRRMDEYAGRGYAVKNNMPPSLGGDKTDYNDYLRYKLEQLKSKQRSRAARSGPAFLR